MIPPGGFTVTSTVTAGVQPEILAVIFAVPPARPVTVTVTLVAPGGRTTVAGTATLGLSELRFTVNPPAGACPPIRFSVRLPEAGRVNVIGPDQAKVGQGTVTVPLPDV
jgi:hypothetical protein